jgi:hypothetical protein
MCSFVLVIPLWSPEIGLPQNSLRYYILGACLLWVASVKFFGKNYAWKNRCELLYSYTDHENNRERYRSGRNGVDSKSICPVNSGARGFESHPLRQNLNAILLNFFRHRRNRIPEKFRRSKHIYGEMSELAEGARLEIACTTNSGTEGSNPSLSAIVKFLVIILCHMKS